ncbi:Putative CAMK/CAMKL/PASK protein kinase [Rhizopus microsporus]|nr:Putative CAMK/CAMKL/PASK protein kinase [Rhizopus microsporus]
MHHILDKNGLKDLYGYDTDEILNEPLSKLIPSLTPSDWKSTIQSRFFGSETKKGAHFPIIVRLLDHTTIHITSMPLIAGLMTIRFDGTIEGCNQVFARCLFGYTQDELLKKNISDLLPQFPTLFKNLNRDDLLQHGLIINNTICRKLVDHYNGPDSRLRMLTHTPNNQPLPLLIGIHRDGTPLEVQLQLKLVEEKEECALWISFDRELTFKRYGHQHLISLPPPVDERQPPPMVRSKKKEILENAILYSAQQPNATCIDDYIVIDELGQGAYGLVKVAVKKDDPEKKRVVIKYVIKSRILVDCWTSDQMLGTIPVEIHILHTLRKIPHKNISDMHDDYYYIVMEFRETMDLFDYIEYNEQINEDNIRKIFKQIALGVKHLHDHRIVHRDIKDENVVVDKDLNVQIVDFGSAAYVKQGRKYETFVGTLDYAAPEILRGQTYSGKPQDVWALGILLFTLIYRENPFYDIDEIMSQELRIPFVLSKGSVDLICKMLERDVEKRIDIQAVLDHPWLN